MNRVRLLTSSTNRSSFPSSCPDTSNSRANGEPFMCGRSKISGWCSQSQSGNGVSIFVELSSSTRWFYVGSPDYRTSLQQCGCRRSKTFSWCTENQSSEPDDIWPYLFVISWMELRDFTRWSSLETVWAMKERSISLMRWKSIKWSLSIDFFSSPYSWLPDSPDSRPVW